MGDGQREKPLIGVGRDGDKEAGLPDLRQHGVEYPGLEPLRFGLARLENEAVKAGLVDGIKGLSAATLAGMTLANI